MWLLTSASKADLERYLHSAFMMWSRLVWHNSLNRYCNRPVLCRCIWLCHLEPQPQISSFERSPANVLLASHLFDWFDLFTSSYNSILSHTRGFLSAAMPCRPTNCSEWANGSTPHVAAANPDISGIGVSLLLCNVSTNRRCAEWCTSDPCDFCSFRFLHPCVLYGLLSDRWQCKYEIGRKSRYGGRE